jgi:hypothetical protein
MCPLCRREEASVTLCDVEEQQFGGPNCWGKEKFTIYTRKSELEKQTLTRLKTNGHNMTILKNTGIPHLALLIGSRKTEH